jgi:secreted trypsin-like serine protease
MVGKSADDHRILGGLLAANAGVAGAVVGGQVVYPSEYPYFVMVISTLPDGPQYQRGGTVIADSVVLTAAHCVDGGVQPGGVTIYIWDVQPETAVGISVHPLRDGESRHGHDLAVVRLAPHATSGVVPIQE